MDENDKKIPLDERRFLYEKESEERRYDLQLRELEVRKLEIESKIQFDRKAQKVSPVTATILVALIGLLATAIATFIQGKNTNALEREKFEYNSKQEDIKFQSGLINKALEASSQKDRIDFLIFLTKIKLINDDSLSKRISDFIQKTPQQVPFSPSESNLGIKGKNINLYTTMEINPECLREANIIVDKIIANKSRYEYISLKTNVPWQVIALIHQLDSNLDFSLHLHNGDPLTARTFNVPAGRPKVGAPPFTWEESAIDLITYNGLNLIDNWSTSIILDKIELNNGLGYRRQNINSPYLWAGTNYYKSGKYIKDGQFDPNVIYKQLGAAVILKTLEKRKFYQYSE